MAGQKKDRNGLGIFFASACITLVVLGALLLLFMLWLKSTEAESKTQNVPYEADYQPEENENLALLLIGCREAESQPGIVQLFYYNAPGGMLYCVTMPPQTACTVNGRTDTIAGHYEYEGLRGSVSAVKSLLGIDVERYLRVQKNGMANLVDLFGGIDCEMEEDREADGQIILKGNQLLDGKRVASLLFDEDERGLADVEEQSELSCRLLSTRFTDKFSSKYGVLTNAFFYNGESNLGRYDFVMREKGVTSLLEQNRLTVLSMVLEGEYNNDFSMFLPDPDSVEDIFKALIGSFEVA